MFIATRFSSDYNRFPPITIGGYTMIFPTGKQKNPGGMTFA